MMHVIYAEGLQDDDYLAKHTLGAPEMRARAAEWTPERAAAITGIPVEAIVSLSRRYGKAKAAFIRVNYGLQRHYGGGMAVRTIACLPAITGHWRRAGGGVQLSSSGNFLFDREALERPDLCGPVRTINMIRLGAALTRADAGVGGPPVKALIVYNSNPAAVAPERGEVLRGLARADLFTVVLEHFQTDTADWADIVLPATTQLEHWDLHFAYGHHYVTLNAPAIAPVGESRPNSEIFRGIAARMGMTHECLRDDDVTLMRSILATGKDKLRGITLEQLKETGWARLNVPRPYVPFANGGFPTPSGRCEFLSSRMVELGFDALPQFTPPREMPEEAPELAARFPLTLVSSPAHQFLNSSFVNVDSLRRGAREPELVIHPDDAAPRDIRTGMQVRIHNDRGEFLAKARVEDSVRPATVWAPSVWWSKFTVDGKNANDTTSQLETDLGHGPVFYDNLVEVSPAD
jgi:anaerobic selenocysteine-containing dehydrogenase